MSSNSSKKPCRHNFKPRYTSALNIQDSIKSLEQHLFAHGNADAWSYFYRIVTEYRKAQLYVYDVCTKCGVTNKEVNDARRNTEP